MNFGQINQYLFLGGGQLLAELAIMLAKAQKKVFVCTSERHAKGDIFYGGESHTLESFLDTHNLEYVVSDNIATDELVLSKINEHCMGISIGAAWIFRKSFIDLFDGRLINLHGTRLPVDRGAGDYSWRILRNERTGIALIHLIDPGVDTGDIVAYKEYIFPDNCRLPKDYQNFSREKYLELMDTFFSMIDSGENFTLKGQPEYLSYYWPRLHTDNHGFIDWQWRLDEIERFVCAFDDPFNGASTFCNGEKIRIKKVSATFVDGHFHPFQQGLIYRKNEDCIFVATRQGCLVVRSVLGDKECDDIRHELNVGDRLYTPREYLEFAMQYRAFYTPSGLKE